MDSLAQLYWNIYGIFLGLFLDNTASHTNIVDICGDQLDGRQLYQPSGYIETPNYPDLYPPDFSCTCNLTAADTAASIRLTLLDLELESNKRCLGDWLEYATPNATWGSSEKICDVDDSHKTVVLGNSVMINFKANGHEEGRGFWLQYEGRLSFHLTRSVIPKSPGPTDLTER